MLNKNYLLKFSLSFALIFLGLFLSADLVLGACGDAGTTSCESSPLRIYVAAFEYDGIDAIISRAKSINADALALPMDGPNQGSIGFSIADFAKINNIKNNNGIAIKPVLWTDITMSHKTYIVVDMNVPANRDAAIAQLEKDIIAHPGIYAVMLEETGHANYTAAAMNDLLTKARDAAHKHGVQLWPNQPTLGPWTETPPIAGWDVDYINKNNIVDAYILQNGDTGYTSTGAVGTLASVLYSHNDNQAKLPNINVLSAAYGWSAASGNTPKCVAYKSTHGNTPGIPECWVQSLFTTVNYFNSRGMPVAIAQVNWGTSADYYYYDTAGYGRGTVLEVMSRIPVIYPDIIFPPAFSIPAGTYSSAQNVSIATPTAGAAIYYTLDGSDPASSPTRITYSSPITVSTTKTIKAKAFKNGITPSATVSATYTIATPVLASITISPLTASLSVGSALTFTAYPKDQFGNPITAALTWSSSNTAVAAITSSGKVTGLTPGTANITATSGTIKGTAQTIIKTIPPAINILANPGFESGTASWNLYTNGTGKFTTITPGYAENKSAKIVLYSGGSNIQLYQQNISLTPNTRYRLSFAAYSTSGHDLSVNLFKHVSPYTNYGLTFTANLGTGWQVFTTEFSTKGFTNKVNDGRLFFWLAPFATPGDAYFIDNVKLEVISP